MATRYYLRSGAAPPAIYHGAVDGAWEDMGMVDRTWSPVQTTLQLSQTKTATSQSASIFRVNQAGDYDALICRWVTPPLAAQSIGGTFDLCHQVYGNFLDGDLGFQPGAVVRYKLHIYLAQGQSTTVRTVLLDNYVDSANFPAAASWAWQQLASAQALTAATATAGDVIVIELGYRVVSSPTLTPVYYPSNIDVVAVSWTGFSSRASYSDATGGATSSSLACWWEFSQTLTELAASAAPANDACADAIVIPSIPYESAFIDASGTVPVSSSADLWWTWTAEQTGVVFFANLGTNYSADVYAYYAPCGGSLLTFPERISLSTAVGGNPRAGSFVCFTATEGETYNLRLVGGTQTPGVARLVGFWRQAPAEDDLYIASGVIAVLRDGQLVNMTADFVTQNPSGIAIDYTQREMDDFNGGTHSGERLLIGGHASAIVEIVDLPTLNLGEAEVDYIESWDNEQPGGFKPAQMHITAEGELYQAGFGNGYLFVSGTGSLPAFLNTVPNNADYGAIHQLSAAQGSSNPDTDTLHTPTAEHTAAWAIHLDEATGDLYYTSSGYYIDVAGASDVVRVYNINTQVESVFATVPLEATPMPGLKGLQFIPGGGVLVANGNVVQRLDTAGAIVTTYTPSVPLESQSLCDVRLTADATAFWTVDIQTARVFKFDLATGAELATYQPYLRYGALVQTAIYQPDGVAVPPAPSVTCEDTPLECWSPGETALGCITPAQPSAGCWSPGVTPVGCITPAQPSGGCWSSFSPTDMQVGRSTGDAQ